MSSLFSSTAKATSASTTKATSASADKAKAAKDKAKAAKDKAKAIAEEETKKQIRIREIMKLFELNNLTSLKLNEDIQINITDISNLQKILEKDKQNQSIIQQIEKAKQKNEIYTQLLNIFANAEAETDITENILTNVKNLLKKLKNLQSVKYKYLKYKNKYIQLKNKINNI